MIAKALPNDDVIAECEDEVAVVHLTWTQKQERPPWPLTTFMASAEEFESACRVRVRLGALTHAHRLLVRA